MMLSVLPMAVFKSVSLICANFKNSEDNSSRVVPVTPKRVLTSPIAVPTSLISTGSEPNTLFALLLRLSKASPVHLF
ncbi:hypothetical protein [Clostridium estertheticum]|uniref:hypothetical protein n=1 Tax=Clostridium estertheticum TaxID=238834 RepID=UPI001C0DAB6F|nr:hypothetical protein [Clostridium estertheticum]MBU3173721.1 hypothetical protein [Clostridium estertheticum]